MTAATMRLIPITTQGDAEQRCKALVAALVRDRDAAVLALGEAVRERELLRARVAELEAREGVQP